MSSRHFDDFYRADAILLVEDSEKPFVAASGKQALLALARHGYLAKSHLVFSKLDQGEEARPDKIEDVHRGLRNLVHALAADDDLWIDPDAFDIHYLADMHREEPDEPSKAAMRSLLSTITAEAATGKPGFVQPTYDFELLATCLDKATAAFRDRWDGYLASNSASRTPWQTVKAFTYRLAWGQEEYKDLQPVTNLHEALVTALEPFITHPTGWGQEATSILQQASIDRVKQEFSHGLLQLIREMVIYHNHQGWHAASELRGPGSTQVRAAHIRVVLHAAAPLMTEAPARSFKDAVKACVHSALQHCAG